MAVYLRFAVLRFPCHVKLGSLIDIKIFSLVEELRDYQASLKCISL